MSYFEPKFENCYSCECCEMLHVCRVEVDAKTEFVEPSSIHRRSLRTKLVRQLARVFCGQAVLLLAIVVSGCFDFSMLPDEVAASKVHISVVSTGIGASFELFDRWMVRDAEFGAVTITGGGSDSDIWTEQAVSPAVVQEYVDWIISCAKQVDGIHSVAIKVNGEEVAIWRTPVKRNLGELVEILVIVVGDDPEGFASQWSPECYRTIQVSHVDNIWGFRLHAIYLSEFIRHVTFVGSYGQIAVANGITQIDVFQSGNQIGGWLDR